MKKYNLKKRGSDLITNTWYSNTGDETYWEPCFGKPERWALHKSEMYSEEYDEADVLEEREVVVVEASEKIPEVWNEDGELVQAEVPAVEEKRQKQVKLKAEYTIEIVDITAEHELAECLKKRRAEYPSAEEFLNVFFDGGSAELEALKAKRLEIKAKYPKPVAGE